METKGWYILQDFPLIFAVWKSQYADFHKSELTDFTINFIDYDGHKLQFFKLQTVIKSSQRILNMS